MGRLGGLLTLLLVCTIGFDRAHAVIDLTGSWKIEGDFETFTQEMTQSGTSLTIGEYVGTIDLITGAFMLEGPRSPGGILPVLGGLEYYASPPPTIRGTASADGNHFDAEIVLWFVMINPLVDFVHYPWASATFPHSGTRRDLTQCGDGGMDPDELCDGGDTNGVSACCSAVCTVIDTDHDGFCDAADDCPTIQDAQQDCADPLVLTSARATATGRLRAGGTLSDRGGPFSEVLWLVGPSQGIIATQCEGDALRDLRCTNTDRSMRLRVWRRRGVGPWTFRLSAKDLSVAAAQGPIGAGVIDGVNSRMERGELTSCVTQATRVTCGP